MSDGFVHLHNHLDPSKLDGHMRAHDMFAAVRALHQSAVATTDHGFCTGHFDVWKNSRDYEVDGKPIKPILGVELYVAPSGPDGEPSDRTVRKPIRWRRGRDQWVDEQHEGKDVSGAGAYTHQTMWARNAAGLRNLWTITGLASRDGFYRQPRADHALIAVHAEGLMATTGCPSGEVQTRLRLGQTKLAEAAVARDLDIFGRDYYFLEVMDHGNEIEKLVRDDLLALGKRMGLRPLATNDAHYATEADAPGHDALLAISSQYSLDHPDRFRFDGTGYYLKSAAQMRELFSDMPEACDNTLLVAEMVESYDEVFAHRNRMAKYPVPEGYTPLEYLRKLILDGLRRLRGGEPTPADIARIEYELTHIAPSDPGKTDWTHYFLWVYAICRFCRENEIVYGPRGSAAGSLVNYSLGISPGVDPMRHGLLFERFINPDRVSPPDIDLDVDDRRRDEIDRWLREQCGDEYTANIITFGVLGGKQSIKDSTRILGIEISKGEEATRAYPEPLFGKALMLADIFNPEHPRVMEGAAAEFLALFHRDPTVKKIVETARTIEGRIKSYGVHPCGRVQSDEPLLGSVPLIYDEKTGIPRIGFEYDGKAESMGLQKMDLLGLRNLREIGAALGWIEKLHGVKIDLNDESFDDPEVYKLLARGETATLFQLEGSGMRELLRRMRPTGIEDIIAVGALYRPGPMGMDSHNLYADRKNGRIPVQLIHPELGVLQDVLAETYGVICYQEQVMRAVQVAAGFSPGRADLLRKAMGKKQKATLDKERPALVAGMAERGMSEAAATALWETLEPFADYAFNKAHAACYARIAYWTAYLKVHYPVEWMAAVLSAEAHDKTQLGIYLAEARRMGIEVTVPDINESDHEFTPTPEGKIRFGLKAIRDVGENVVAAVLAGRRQKPYADFLDFLERAPAAACTAKAVTGLIEGGCFDQIEDNRHALTEACSKAVKAARDAKKLAALGVYDLFTAAAEPEITDEGEELERIVLTGLVVDRTVPQFPRDVQLDLERERLGLYVSGHPLQDKETTLAVYRSESTAELLGSSRTEGDVRLCGQITSVEVKHRKKDGAPWAIVTLEDLEGSVTVNFYTRAYQAVAEQLVTKRLVTIKARLFGDVQSGGDDDSELVVEQKISGVYCDEVQIVDPDAALPVRLHYDRCNQAFVDELRRICDRYPGEQLLTFHLIMADKSVQEWRPPNLRVQMSPPFVSEMKELAGRNCFARRRKSPSGMVG